MTVKMNADDFVAPSTLMTTHKVVVHHKRWVAQNEKEYSAKARRFLTRALNGGYRKPRVGRISVSGLGHCQRKQLFSALGMRQTPTTSTSAILMDMGTWSHLRWQAEGLTVGWLSRAEVWLTNPKRLNLTFPVGGSMDGLLAEDGSGFELKTTNYSTFKKVQQGEVPASHLRQVNAYMMLANGRIPEFTLVYEYREWGEPFELTFTPDLEIEHELREEVTALRSALSTGTPPPMLPDCEIGTGNTYKQCPYRHDCPLVKSLFEIPTDE